MSEIGRNAACPCGSGLKYKRCCAVRSTETSLLSRVALSAVAIMLIGGAVFLLSSLDDHEGRIGPTRVWSEAHGHWH
jgi:uncharacterized protein YchJ